MEERRKHMRVDMCTEVEYEIMPLGGARFDGKVKDLSMGGLCLVLSEKVELKSALRLKLSLPDKGKTQMECLARVIWRKKLAEGYLTGIEFVNLDVSCEIKLNMFILNFLKELKDYSNSS